MLILITPSVVVVLVWGNDEDIPRIPAVMMSLFWTVMITLIKATLIYVSLPLENESEM